MLCRCSRQDITVQNQYKKKYKKIENPISNETELNNQWASANAYSNNKESTLLHTLIVDGLQSHRTWRWALPWRALKEIRRLHGGEADQWLLVTMAKQNHHAQKQEDFKGQLLENSSKGELLLPPPPPAMPCLWLSGRIWLATVGRQNAREEGPEVGS